MSEKHPKGVFYGWWIVAASLLISLYVVGVIFYGFTTLFEPIANEFGWSYTQISVAASLRGLAIGLLAPFMGILCDRWGPRKLIFSGGVCTALGLFLFSHATSLGMLYGAFILASLGLSSCTMTVLMTAVANWFRKNIGIASGIAVCGFGLGGLLVPVMVTLIDMYEWRMTMIILAVGMLAIVLPLSRVFRHKPEQYGYLPDGQVGNALIFDKGLGLSKAAEVKIKAKQVFKSITFWHIALAFTYQMLVINAVVTHVMPYLSSIGVARSRASLVATAIPLTSIAGRLGLGWLGDKLDRRWVAAGTCAMMGLGLLCFGYTTTASIWLLVPFLVLLGTGYGGSNALLPSLTREFFGRINFGTVFGLIVGINMLGAIIGPILAGWVFDNWRSCQGLWLVLALLAVAVLIIVVTTPRVSSQVHSSERQTRVQRRIVRSNKATLRNEQ